LNCNLVLPLAAPYEMDMLVLNLEGRYRLIKQNLRSNINLYTNWEIFLVLTLYQKKYINLYIFLFFKYFEILSYFKILLNYFCNFFLVLDQFFIEFFFFTGYTNKTLKINSIILYNFEYMYKLKIVHNL